MIDLEQEFEMLRRMVLSQIDSKVKAGLYSEEEAEGIRALVIARMVAPAEPAWDSSYEACEIEGYPGWERLQRAAAEEQCPTHGGPISECGWSSSMGYHCY